jgi:hypothetical protein
MSGYTPVDISPVGISHVGISPVNLYLQYLLAGG